MSGRRESSKQTGGASNDASWGWLVLGLVFAVLAALIANPETPGMNDGGWDEARQQNLAAHTQQHQRQPAKQEFALHIPRVTLEELEFNATLRSGHHAYVVTGMVSNRWRAMNWTLKKLKKKIPFEWVDYYKESLPTVGHKPYLFRLKEAVNMFKEKSEYPRYMQIRLSLGGWQQLQGDLDPMPLPDVFWSDDLWAKDCMKTDKGTTDDPAVDNFYRTNQWKFLLIGEKGSSMFFHKDHLAASSWQAQLVGRKQWTICPNTESHLLRPEIDTYNPDYRQHPWFAMALCGQVTVNPGDFLYYPAYFWHHARQLDTPTIAYTGLLVGNEAERSDLGGMERRVHKQMYQDLREKCSKCWSQGKKERHCEDISVKWPGAAPPPLRRVCDMYLKRCFRLWDEHAKYLNSQRQRKG